ncbi:MAG: ATP-binding protein [Edaphocola sp.]
MTNSLLNTSLKRIVIIGPESTGKSTLAQQLAAHYGTAFVPEYARAYLEQKGGGYVYEDLRTIAEGQLAGEDEAALGCKGNYLFCDTDLQVIKVWSEHKYDTCHEWVLQQIAVRPYDFYILTDIDMPWQEDPLREHPQPPMRQFFFHQYLDVVQHTGVPFMKASGSAAERLAAAVHAIDSLCR